MRGIGIEAQCTDRCGKAEAGNQGRGHRARPATP
jgi:hypothetical protein